ncbi:MAG: cytochrome c oxidase subunit 3 [Acidobacteriota bacterium]
MMAVSGINVKPGIGAGGGQHMGGDGGGPQGNDPNHPDWPPGFSRDDAIEPKKYKIGMWLGIISVAMLFVALTSAYIIRQIDKDSGGLAKDWFPLQIPSALWITTGVILISSITFEFARRALKKNQYEQFKNWLVITTALGAIFLIGQVIAWRQLAGQGIYLSSHPHSSFFYILSGLHAVHLIGGVMALSYVTLAALKLRITERKRNAVEVTSLYWHFMDGLWIYLFVLLFFF